MPNPSRIATVATALTATLAAASAAPAAAAEPTGKIIVFVTEGAQISAAGTKLKEFSPSPRCQSLPPGAHVVINDSGARLLLFSDPFCLTPVPPPFNFISPGYGAHVAPTGSFRTA